VRDARVILSREVRHSILKITPGGSEKEPAASEALGDDTADTAAPPQATPGRRRGDKVDKVPSDASSEDLHQRHVDAEHQAHAHSTAAAAEEPKQPDLPL